jgi:hypothetical protein
MEEKERIKRDRKEEMWMRIERGETKEIDIVWCV